VLKHCQSRTAHFSFITFAQFAGGEHNNNFEFVILIDLYKLELYFSPKLEYDYFLNIMLMNSLKCYLCDDIKHSVEHAPPKGFFPKGMRNNLITVPSCQIHNEETSSDDEYTRNIITMAIDNNQTSVDQFFEKSLKSIKRNKVASQQILDSLKDVNYHNIATKAFKIDRQRFDKTIRKIAYALYYKDFGDTWKKNLVVITNQFVNENLTGDNHIDIFNSLSTDLDALEFNGENPDVFKYSFVSNTEEGSDKGLFMLFYDGFPIWVIFDPDSNEPSLD
jgi:hypothetical protein